MCTRPELNSTSLVQLAHPEREKRTDGFFTAVRTCDSGSVAVVLDAAGRVFSWDKSEGSKLMPLTGLSHVSRTVRNMMLLLRWQTFVRPGTGDFNLYFGVGRNWDGK